MRVTFHVPGIPSAKGRPRFARRGKFVRAYTPAETEQAELTLAGIVALQVHNSGARFDGPVDVRLLFELPRPKKLPKGRTEPIVSPDLDNYVKLCLDALNRSGIWRDDSQVVRLEAQKVYAQQQPCTTIDIRGH